MPDYAFLTSGERLGRVLDDEEISAMTNNKMKTAPTACGAEGVLFEREDGTFGVEDADSCHLHWFEDNELVAELIEWPWDDDEDDGAIAAAA